MALTTNKATPKFENTGDEGDGNTVDNGAEAGAAETRTMSADERVAAQAAKNASRQSAAPEVKAEDPAPAAAPSASREVAAAKSNAVAKSIMSHDPTAALENALTVQYDTLTQIMVTNGNVVLREGKELMGDHVGLELISFQNHWVCSPGGKSNDDESKEFLKFSDDGKTVRDTGESLTEAVQRAKDAGYPEARIVERMILVGALVYPGKDKKGQRLDELQDELVQIDLAPRSMNNFKAFRANAAFKVSRGLLAPEAALRVCLYCKVMSKGDNNWTDADFKILTDADMK